MMPSACTWFDIKTITSDWTLKLIFPFIRFHNISQENLSGSIYSSRISEASNEESDPGITIDRLSDTPPKILAEAGRSRVFHQMDFVANWTVLWCCVGRSTTIKEPPCRNLWSLSVQGVRGGRNHYRWAWCRVPPSGVFIVQFIEIEYCINVQFSLLRAWLIDRLLQHLWFQETPELTRKVGY